MTPLCNIVINREDPSPPIPYYVKYGQPLICMNIWLIKALKWIHFTTRVKRSALNKNYNQPQNIRSATRSWQSCRSCPVNDPDGPQLLSLDEDDDGESLQVAYL